MLPLAASPQAPHKHSQTSMPAFLLALLRCPGMHRRHSMPTHTCRSPGRLTEGTEKQKQHHMRSSSHASVPLQAVHMQAAEPLAGRPMHHAVAFETKRQAKCRLRRERHERERERESERREREREQRAEHA